MKQYKFSLKDECMKELIDYSKSNYQKNKSNLQSIPVPKQFLNQFENDKVYNEDDFEITNFSFEKVDDYTQEIIEGKFAIPKQKVNDTELWIEVLKIANEWNTGTSIYSYVIKELQKQFTITRK